MTMFPKQRREAGQAVITAVIFFLVGSLVIVAGIARPVLRDIRIVGDTLQSKRSYLFAEGAGEEVMYRIKSARTYDSTESLVDGQASSTVTVAEVGGETQVTSVGDRSDLYRKVQTSLVLASGTSFYYGIQTDVGGLILNNNAQVRGNAYSNGSIVSSNGAVIYGDAVSAGEEGFFQGQTTGAVYANFISGSQVGGDAYYQAISGSTVSGTQHPGSPNQPILALPDLSSEIAAWESSAEAGGTVTCTSGTYSIKSSATLGPAKVPCDLSISNGATVTLLGNVWVVGNITIQNNVTVQVDSSLGGTSVALIADDPADRIEGSYINISNNVDLLGTGGGSSSIMLVSLNEAGEDGIAINYNNNGGENDAIFYAPQGFVNLNNNASISAIVAYIANVNNNTEIDYKSGLTSVLFSSGPGGTYAITGWQEIQ